MKNEKSTLLGQAFRCLLILSGVLGEVTGSAAQGVATANQVVTYAAPQGVAASTDYTVAADGHSVFVYTAPTLRGGPASFASFDFQGSAGITIDSTRDVQSVKILPLSYGITPTINGRKIQFTLSQPRNVTIEINGSYDKALHLFANPLETDPPRADDPHVLYFGPGLHDVSRLQLRDGMTLYLAGGAILRSVIPPDEKPTNERDWAGQKCYKDFIHADGVKNIRICGRGIIDMTGLPWHARTTMALWKASNVTIEGITIIGAPCWAVALFGSRHIHIRNIKEICARENSDGIDLCNSQDVLVEDCFLRNNDDEVCVKTTSPPPAHVSKNIVVQNCVIWNERARALGITSETRQDIHNVLFRDCDIIHDFSSGDVCAPLAVLISDSGTIRNIRFEDIRLEDVKANLALCCIVKDRWGSDKRRGHLKDVTFKNITVSGSVFPKSVIAGYDDKHLIENVTFDHLVIQGQVIGDAQAGKISTNSFVRNVQFLNATNPASNPPSD